MKVIRCNGDLWAQVKGIQVSTRLLTDVREEEEAMCMGALIFIRQKQMNEL